MNKVFHLLSTYQLQFTCFYNLLLLKSVTKCFTYFVTTIKTVLNFKGKESKFCSNDCEYRFFEIKAFANHLLISASTIFIEKELIFSACVFVKKLTLLTFFADNKCLNIYHIFVIKKYMIWAIPS